MCIGGELVVTEPARHLERLGQRALGELDVAEHSPRPAEHGEYPTEIRQVTGRSELAGQFPGLSCDVGGVTLDPIGQLGNLVHLASVRRSLDGTRPVYGCSGRRRAVAQNDPLTRGRVGDVVADPST